jgi:hypothetical protein
VKIDLFDRAVREPEKVIKIRKMRQQRYVSLICGGGTPEDGELELTHLLNSSTLSTMPNFISFQ